MHIRHIYPYIDEWACPSRNSCHKTCHTIVDFYLYEWWVVSKVHIANLIGLQDMVNIVKGWWSHYGLHWTSCSYLNWGWTEQNATENFFPFSIKKKRLTFELQNNVDVMNGIAEKSDFIWFSLGVYIVYINIQHFF